MFQGLISEYFGIEHLLALSAAKFGRHQILMVQNWNQPWKQYQMGMEKYRDNISDSFLEIKTDTDHGIQKRVASPLL